MDFTIINVKPDGSEALFAETDYQGEADVAEPYDADYGCAIFYFGNYLLFMGHG